MTTVRERDRIGLRGRVSGGRLILHTMNEEPKGKPSVLLRHGWIFQHGSKLVDLVNDELCVPGKEAALPPPPPLRTARESFPSSSSSLHKRPLRDAAAFVRPSCTWICR